MAVVETIVGWVMITALFLWCVIITFASWVQSESGNAPSQKQRPRH